jgi:hypothetical protein
LIAAYLRNPRIKSDESQIAVDKYGLTAQVDSVWVVGQVTCGPQCSRGMDCGSTTRAAIGRAVPTGVAATAGSAFAGVGACAHPNDAMRALATTDELLDQLGPIGSSDTEERYEKR